MKKLLLAVPLLLVSALCSARINVLEPWHPGQDTKIGRMYTYQMAGGFLAGDQVQEIPFHFTYVSGPHTEVGGRWGLKNANGNFGINDLILGMKYSFLEESPYKPGVIGEVAASLPTADYKKGLGTGSVGLLFNWAMEKRIEDIIGYFGLGMNFYSENSDNVQPGNIFSYHVGGSYAYTKQWRLHLELKGYNHGISKTKGVKTAESFQELYLAPGANYIYADRELTLSSALLVGLTSESHKLGFIFVANF